MTMSPVMVARDEGARFHFLNTLHTAKITGEQTNGTLTAVEFLAHVAEVCSQFDIQVLGPPPAPIG